MPTYSILQRYKSRNNKTWYGRINDGGVIKYISLKTKRKADAVAWLDAKNAARFFPELVAKNQNKDLEINKVLIEFMAQKEKTLGSAGSFTMYTNVMNVITRYCKESGLSNMAQWTPKNAQGFSNWLTTNDYSPRVTRQFVGMASQVFKWASRNYSLNVRNPFEGVEKPKLVKRVTEFWTPEEIDRILDNAPSPGLRLEWAFMAFAGLRRHEANKVAAADIKEGQLRVIGKGNKEAFLPVSERLAKEIERAGGVIHSASNDYTKLCNLKKAANEAGASGKANPHKFRHSFASNLFRAGVGVKYVQNLMRHENVEITLNTYGHLLQEDLNPAVNKLK